MSAANGARSSKRYLNRELSWLDFNHRVLALARDRELPLLERIRFVAIHASNLDEFFQVRVPTVLDSIEAGVRQAGADGLTPREQLKGIRAAAAVQLGDASSLFEDELRPALAAEGISFVGVDDLDATSRAWIAELFSEQVFPVLTPLAVDPAHPFPYISDLSLNLAVFVEHSRSGPSFARVKVPPILPRFLALPDENRFITLESVIAGHLGDLFPGVKLLSHSTFRVTRDADLDIDDTETDDLLKHMELELRQRRFGGAVRLEAAPDLGDDALDMLTRELKLTHDDVYTSAGLLGLSDLFELYRIDRDDLKTPPHSPRTPLPLRATTEAGALLASGTGDRRGAVEESETGVDFFDVLKRQDVLVHLPYESFTTSLDAFIRQAADDPDVLAIKLTMYRTSERTRLVDSLIRAAERGKQVVVVVELKARFDEHANIEWARILERAGVHVAYGVVGLKTHCKLAMVVRREPRGIAHYCFVGTGNFNADTARIYEDFGLLTADRDFAADVAALFNSLTGYSRKTDYRKLAVAPHSLGQSLVKHIAAEAAEPDGHIFMKMNAIVDSEVIDALYEASQQGCRIDLVVRGICCLVPGIAGMSENISVRSIVGRFLEHSRVYRFGNRDRGYTILLGSADAMPRNLRYRVEALAPVEAPALISELVDLTDMYLDDGIARWELGSDGEWTKHCGTDLHHSMLTLHADRRG
ncbi:MAG: polyphosphate kinase 1 [Acidimicrobiaceae bacterium]|nr:polyphosphate kinase 1 [Acidimicrobiaceae bacterium]MYA27471.1 polyphosphate kinase 1 [Acidimicrobiales bacterium]MDE0676361.1 polyphosphate kinase 1 [Acidimicrobiaceae bacterium]MYA83473.1 polyphosphate kinase 1 [Acidimicrobiales bacterium]MYD82587.1 polyphosphate kinase 1 [Acidimicrobiales bacterium]